MKVILTHFRYHFEASPVLAEVSCHDVRQGCVNKVDAVMYGRNPHEGALAARRGCHALVHQESGSVIMEYIILNFLFLIALIGSGLFFVAPDGGMPGGNTYYFSAESGGMAVGTEKTRRFGILGDALMQRYDMMVQVVSMPYP